MTTVKLVQKLVNLGFTPEAYDDQLYQSGSYGSDSKNNGEIEREVGTWTVIEKEKDTSDGDYNTVRRTVLYFNLHDIYLAFHIFAGSYQRDTYTDWYEVFPTQTTIFTTKKEEESSSYESSYESSY